MKRELKSNDWRMLDMHMSLSYLQPCSRMRTLVKPPALALCMPILHELNYAFPRNTDSATANLFIGAVTILSSSSSNCELVLITMNQRILTIGVIL